MCNAGKRQKFATLQLRQWYRRSSSQGNCINHAMRCRKEWFAGKSGADARTCRTACHDYHIGATFRCRWLPQQPCRESPTVTKRLGTVKQQDIKIPPKAQVLETVIQQEYVRGKLLHGQLSGSITICADYDQKPCYC